MDRNRLVVKGAILHDIGKLCQRATKERRKHFFIGADFLAKFSDKTEEYRQLLRCVKYHHGEELKTANLAYDDLAYVVYEADNISAGTDCRPIEGDSSYRSFDSGKSMENIFNIFHETETDKKKSYYQVCGMNADNQRKYRDIGYPTLDKVIATAGAYASVMDVLQANFQVKNPKDMEINELLRILEDLTIYIPSSTNTEEVCDISLFDHCKMAGAIAAAMLRWFDFHGISNYKEVCYKKNKEYREKPIFLLVSGDFSGIQKFIYKVPTKGAMRMLRGKSFYLQIMMENIIDEILNKLGLSRVNVIYSGGGHFYLLADNSPRTIEILKESFAKVNEHLLRNFSTSLYLAGAWEELSAAEMMGNKNDHMEANVFQRVNRKVSVAKQQRYEGLIPLLCDEHSDINEIRSGMRECSLCHQSILPDKLEDYALADSENENASVCSICFGLYNLGAKLLDKKSFFAVTSEPVDEGGLEIPGIDRALWCYCTDKEKAMEWKDKGILLRIYSKNDSRTSEEIASRIWVADYAATYHNKVLNFEELAELVGGTTDSRGIYRLGVLRANVDWLGLAFMAGFTNKYGAFSRYATLSRNLSMFFGRFIDHIAEKQLPSGITPFYLLKEKREDKPRYIHIVYSGGDDLFVVGAWDDLLEFAVDLRRVFALYTNDKLSFSAGLGLYSPKFPIIRMASETGEMESLAKSDIGKNRIALFGVQAPTNQEGGVSALTCNWEEIQEIKDNQLAFLLSHFIFLGINDNEENQQNKISGTKTLLYKLLLLLREKKINIARFAYILARMKPIGKISPEKNACYEEVKLYLYEQVTKSEKQRKQLEIALNFIIYQMRDK